MRQFLLSKSVIVTLIAVVAIHALLAFASFSPSTRADMSDLPVGVVDLDGEGLASQLLEVDHEMLQWNEVSSRTLLDDMMVEKDLYAGIVIPEGASEALEVSATSSQQVELELIVNEGADAAAATASAGVISGIVDEISHAAFEQHLATLEADGGVVEPGDLSALTSPVVVEQSIANPAGGQEGAQVPLMLVVLAWIGTLITSLVVWLSLHRTGQTPYGFLGSQLIVGAGIAVLQPFSIVLLARGIAGIDLTFTGQIYLALLLASLAFYMLQSAVLNWAGFGGWPILVMIWLFSFGMLSMAPEALSSFYRDGIYSWIPIRFPFEAIQGVLFFDGEGVTNRMLWITAAIAAGSAAAVAASIPVLRRRDLSVSPMRARLDRFENPPEDSVQEARVGA